MAAHVRSARRAGRVCSKRMARWSHAACAVLNACQCCARRAGAGPDNEKSTVDSKLDGGEAFSDGFHVFACDWEEDFIRSKRQGRGALSCSQPWNILTRQAAC